MREDHGDRLLRDFAKRMERNSSGLSLAVCEKMTKEEPG